MKLVVGQESKASNPGRALGPRGWDQILQVLPSRYVRSWLACSLTRCVI